MSELSTGEGIALGCLAWLLVLGACVTGILLAVVAAVA